MKLQFEPMPRQVTLILAALAAVTPLALAADWPQWRGPDRNGISKETGWTDQFPEQGPAIAWKANVGLGFSSFVHASEIQAMSVKTGTMELYDRVKVPLDPSRFEVSQVRYPSKDGTEITMFVVSLKGLPRNGEAPVLLYGYGGFNISETPAFWSTRIPWIERGGIFAVAST